MTNETERHFTATTFIIANGRVLLLRHKKIGTWLPPGGHVEPNELPHETAMREAMEETGIKIELLHEKNFEKQQEFLAKHNDRTTIIPRPWKVLLEKIADNHFHIDLTYIAKANTTNVRSNEGHELKWFTEKELEQEKSLFPDVRLFAKMALKKSQKN